MRVDLHVHTSHSDGELSVKQLLALAQEQDIQYLAKCDHDTVTGNDEFVSEAENYGVNGIPGIEISAEWQGHYLHILGLGVSSDQALWRELIDFNTAARRTRMGKMIQGLIDQGFVISLADVEAVAAGKPLSRPQIAIALTSHPENKDKILEVFDGQVPNFHEFIEKYLIDGKPAYAHLEAFPLRRALSLINEAGGLNFLAHPKGEAEFYLEDDVLEELVKSHRSLDGLEVYNYFTTAADQQKLQDLADQYKLMVTGGTDFHVKRVGQEMGRLADGTILTVEMFQPLLDKFSM